jgi:hypothetical protein
MSKNSKRGTRRKDKCRVPHPDHPEWLCDRHKRHDDENGGHKTHPYIEAEHCKVEFSWSGVGRSYDPDNPYITPAKQRRLAEQEQP